MHVHDIRITICENVSLWFTVQLLHAVHNTQGSLYRYASSIVYWGTAPYSLVVREKYVLIISLMF